MHNHYNMYDATLQSIYQRLDIQSTAKTAKLLTNYNQKAHCLASSEACTRFVERDLVCISMYLARTFLGRGPPLSPCPVALGWDRAAAAVRFQKIHELPDWRPVNAVLHLPSMNGSLAWTPEKVLLF